MATAKQKQWIGAWSLIGRRLWIVFGDKGRHTRSAIGVAALPRGAAVEIEVTAAVSERQK